MGPCAAADLVHPAPADLGALNRSAEYYVVLEYQPSPVDAPLEVPPPPSFPSNITRE